MPRGIEAVRKIELSPEEERDFYIDSIVKEIEETGEPKEIITECKNGTIVETVEPVTIFEEGGKFEVLGSTKIEFVSKDGKVRINFNDLLKSNKVHLINTRYNLERLGIDKEKYEKESKEGKFFYQQSSHSEEHGWQTFILYSDLSNMGNKISLLHEISHSHRTKFKEEKLAILQNELLMTYDQTRADIDDDLRTAKKKRGEILYRPLSYDSKEQDFLPVPKEDFLAFHEANAEEENRAWNYALEVLKKYRRRGLDLEPELPTEGELDFFIHSEHMYGLGDYEADLEERQGGPDSEKIRGLYSEKMYELREEVKRAEEAK